MFTLLNCNNKVLKGDKKDTAIIQSFSSVALIVFTCLILYKHSKKLINKDKTSTVNTGTFFCPQGCKDSRKETNLMSEPWEKGFRDLRSEPALPSDSAALSRQEEEALPSTEHLSHRVC